MESVLGETLIVLSSVVKTILSGMLLDNWPLGPLTVMLLFSIAIEILSGILTGIFPILDMFLRIFLLIEFLKK
jgi:hypothetical protein